MIESTTEWLSSTGVPNGLFVVALLTTPHKWSRWVVDYVESRLEKETGEES